LAAQLNIHDPQVVQIVSKPPECLQLSVVSRPTLEGHRVFTSLTSVRRVKGKGCKPPEARFWGEQIGNWIRSTSAQLGDERWRLRDGHWHSDVQLGRDVPYEDAQAIARAFRRGAVSDHRSAEERRRRNIPPINAEWITAIFRASTACVPTSHSKLYSLGNWASLDSVVIRIVDSRVEVLCVLHSIP
jgi:hypothetical protein